ncbi:MAG TPA: TPM domain-containing protein [Chthoniobacterales bacterium]
MRAIFRWFFVALLVCGLLTQICTAESLPPKPTRYVSDRALVLDDATSEALNQRLANFERETSNQIVVAIFSRLPEGAEIAQYATEVFHAWGVGQKDKDNGAVLFIFQADRKLFIATGRGLEGALPDATCKQIIESEIVPRFRQNDYAGGIRAGVESMIAATKGEYVGTGTSVHDREQSASDSGDFLFSIILFFVILMILLTIRNRMRGMVVTHRGYRNYGGGWTIGTGGGGFDRGPGGGGFGGGGDSGGFSGGGGDSGGGGAGGSW